MQGGNPFLYYIHIFKENASHLFFAYVCQQVTASIMMMDVKSMDRNCNLERKTTIR